MIDLNYQMVLMLLQIFKNILNKSFASPKHHLQFILFMFRLVFKINDQYELELQTP